MRKTLQIPAAVAAFALLATACGSSDDTTTTAGTGTDLSGSVIVSGSSTVEPISARVGEAFRALNPNVTVSVEGPGTSDGFAKFCAGETDISDASRTIRAEEIESCATNGIEWIELHIAIDGLSVLTSKDNDVHTCLTFGDLYALLGPESIRFNTWIDAGGIAAGIDGTSGDSVFIDQDLVVTGPGEESGTYDSFVDLVLGDIAEERGQDVLTRPDYVASANDNVIIDGIAGSQYSLGWVGYAFYANNTDKVKALEVDGSDGCVAPTPETIADGSYPIARPLFFYVNANKLVGNPSLEAFVDFYLSDAGLAAVVDAGYVSLQDYGPTKDTWANKVTGSVSG